MALQDLTPQLRTRLGRMERAVGIFVGLAAALLLSGFFYYLYHTAVRKGWFLKKVPYYVYVQNASGLKTGDPVKLMSFDVGEITKVTSMPPDDWFVVNRYNVFVGFVIKEPYYGYIWTDSRVKISAGDFLGNRILEVIKGQARAVVTNMTVITAQLREFNGSLGRWLFSPDLNEQLELAATNANSMLVSADTNLLAVADKLTLALDHLGNITSNLNAQVQSNTNMLAGISAAVSHTDELVQGLKRHWLLRSAFRTKTTNQ